MRDETSFRGASSVENAHIFAARNRVAASAKSHTIESESVGDGGKIRRVATFFGTKPSTPSRGFLPANRECSHGRVPTGGLYERDGDSSRLTVGVYTRKTVSLLRVVLALELSQELSSSLPIRSLNGSAVIQPGL